MESKKLSDIFTRVGNDILKFSDAVKIDVYTDTRKMDIKAECVKMVRYDSCRKLSEQIAEAYRLREVNLSFVYNPSVFGENCLSTVAGYIKDFPQLLPVIENSEISYDGKVLKISCINPAIVGNDAKQALADAVFSMFGLEIEIVFEQLHSSEEMIKKLEEDKAEVSRKIMEIRAERALKQTNSPVIYGREIKDGKNIKLSEVDELSGNVTVEGYLFKKEPDIRTTRNGAHIVTFSITDDDYAIDCKLFTDDNSAFEVLEKRLKKGVGVRVRGVAQNDKYARELLINVRDINEIEIPKREDNADKKRVELHMHTKMSTMDAMADADALVKQAIKWGHKAVAVTDHGDVQAFPEAYHASNWGKDIKVLYGVECYLVNDEQKIVVNPIDCGIDTEYVVFDIETTGL